MTQDTACLVACGKHKRDGSQPAWGLYDSTLFEKSWGAASLLGDPFVMSAKHGLLTVDSRLRKYDESLTNYTSEQKREWAAEVVEDLPDHYDTVVLFGGRDYVEPLKRSLDRVVVDVYEGTTGNGEQMAVATEIMETELNGGDYL